MASTGNLSTPFHSSTPREDDEAKLYAFQLTSGSILPMAVKATVELGVIDVISKAAKFLSPEEIATELGTANPEAPLMLDRILRLLASYNILTCRLDADTGTTRSYGPAPVCKYLTASNEDGMMSALSLMHHDRVFMESWYHLKDAVMEGGVPFNKAHGMTAFEYPRTDPRFNKLFNKAMSDYATLVMKNILRCYTGFEGLNTLVDVGGGVGTCLSVIVSKYPHIRAINFDLHHVIADAPSIPGVEHVGGDMFEAVPAADAIFMKWILHDWSDQHCLKLLENCCKVLPEGGKVIVAEALLPVAPEPTLAARFVFHVDLAMLAYNPGGKERTEGHYGLLAKKAGFSGFAVACRLADFAVLEFTK